MNGERAAIRITAHAKLNLGLRVLAREAGGHHQLETIFVRLALADEVVIRTGGSTRTLDCRGTELGPVEQNLAWRAATAYVERCGWPSGFAIELEKRIPVGGGLGGGSADAGAVLRALNALAPAPLPDAELLRLALVLGADVPYLTTTVPLALAWGRGERMLSLPEIAVRPVLLLVPPFGVATSDVFSWLAAERDAGRATRHPPSIFDVERLSSWEVLASMCGNDLEHVVTQRHAMLGEVLARMREAGVASCVGMSGSGSTLFAIGDEERAPVFAPPAEWRTLRTEAPAHVLAPQRIE